MKKGFIILFLLYQKQKQEKRGEKGVYLFLEKGAVEAGRFYRPSNFYSYTSYNSCLGEQAVEKALLCKRRMLVYSRVERRVMIP